MALDKKLESYSDSYQIQQLTTSIVRKQLAILNDEHVAPGLKKEAMEIIACVSQAHDRMFGKQKQDSDAFKSPLGRIAQLVESE